MTLTEQMKTLVDEVTSMHADRTAAVTRFKKETEETLKADATALREMSTRMRADLATNVQDRSKQVHALREHARSELRETQVRIRQMLEQTKAERKACLSSMMQAFQETRKQVVADIQGAASAWQQVHCAQGKTEVHAEHEMNPSPGDGQASHKRHPNRAKRHSH